MNIALAIIVDSSRSRVLIAQRPPDIHLGGYWEFPGGKMEAGETAEQCALREAKEETDLSVAVLDGWEPISYVYPDRALVIHPFLCEGDPIEARYGRCLWVHIGDLNGYEFPPANAPLLARLAALASD